MQKFTVPQSESVADVEREIRQSSEMFVQLCLRAWADAQAAREVRAEPNDKGFDPFWTVVYLNIQSDTLKLDGAIEGLTAEKVPNGKRARTSNHTEVHRTFSDGSRLVYLLLPARHGDEPAGGDHRKRLARGSGPRLFDLSEDGMAVDPSAPYRLVEIIYGKKANGDLDSVTAKSLGMDLIHLYPHDDGAVIADQAESENVVERTFFNE